MSRRQTTGKPHIRKDASEHHLSRAEREQYYQRIAILVTVGVVALIAIIVGAALFNDLVIVPEQDITTVNETGITTRDFQKRTEAERWFRANTIREAYELTNDVSLAVQVAGRPPNSIYPDFAQLINDPQSFGEYVLSQMELEVLLKKEADRLGVEIDEGLVQAQVDQYIAIWTNANLTPTPTFTVTSPVFPSTTPIITATASLTPTASNTPEPTTPVVVDGSTATPLPTATLTLTPTATPETTNTPEPTNTPPTQGEIKATIDRFENRLYENANEDADVDRDIIYDIFYFEALREALREEITKDIETKEVWTVHRHILIQVPEEVQPPQEVTEFDEALCESEDWQTVLEEARTVQMALNNGEPFSVLARSISDDPGSRENGGLYNWAVTSTYVPQYKAALETAELGIYTEPVCTRFGWHIIQVLQRETRDIAAGTLEQTRSQEYQSWENDLLNNADIQRRDNWEERIPEEPTFDDLLGDILSLN